MYFSISYLIFLIALTLTQPSLKAQGKRVLEYQVRSHEATHSILQPDLSSADEVYDLNSWSHLETTTGDKVSPILNGPNDYQITEDTTKRSTQHIISAGETLYKIALNYGISEEELIRANSGISRTYFPIGRVLRIPQNKSDKKAKDAQENPSKSNTQIEEDAIYYIHKAYRHIRGGMPREAIKAIKNFETYLGPQLSPNSSSDSISVYYIKTLGTLLLEFPDALDKSYSWETILPYARNLAERGDTSGQNVLGIYASIQGKKEEAMKLFRAASDKGDAHAQWNIGKEYYDANYFAEANTWYTKSGLQAFRKLEPNTDYTYPFYDGLARVRRNMKYGFVNIVGEVIIPIKYDDAGDFREGLARVKYNDEYNFVNKTGKAVIPLGKVSDVYPFMEGFAIVRDKSNNTNPIDDFYRCLDKTGSHFYSEGLVPIRSSDKKEGFNYLSGGTAIPPQYDYVSFFIEKLARVKLNGKYGFINKNGDTNIKFQYDEAGDFHEGKARVKLNGKWGFIDKTGKTVIPFEYDEADDFKEGIASVKLNGKWGIIIFTRYAL